MSTGTWILVCSVPVLFIVFGVLIIIAEACYYDRHPEKERPDVDPWP